MAEQFLHRSRIELVDAGELFGVDAAGDEQAVDPETMGAGQIRAHGIADRQNLAEVGFVAALLGGELHGALVDRPVRLAVEDHLAAELTVEFGASKPSGLATPSGRRPGVAWENEVMAVDLSMPVLVVDDYNTMIRIIRNLLKQLGFENIDDASDGSAALNKMRSKKYGLVISDWNMEPMTGFDLLKEVRGDPNLAMTPFIMVTAESKTENVIAAKKAGVNNYIVKPFNAATLKNKIEAVFPEQ